MKNILIKIQELFCVQELPHDLFHSFDQSLRFELGGDELRAFRPMRRFVRANERAMTVAQTFFENSAEVFVLLSSYGLEQPDKKRLKPLQLCGIERSEFQYLGKTPQMDGDHIAEFGSDLFRHWDVSKLKDGHTISEILWLGIASEMKIEPSFRDSMQAYLVDVSNGLILHVYDDRGMDVIATKDPPLKDLYTTYRAWLLEHDLLRMTAMFGEDT